MTLISATEITRRTDKGAKAKNKSQERPKTTIGPDRAARAPWPTHAAFMALVTLGACGLRAVTPEPSQHAQSEPVDAQTAQQEAPLAPLREEPSVRLQSVTDLPDADTVTAITRRAVNEMAVNHPGFLPSIAAVSACYEGLRADDIEGRVRCLQLDAAAWLVEGAAPLAWRQADAASNDYFTDERFQERRWRQAPPLSAGDDARKRRNLDILDAAITAAMRDYMETLMAPAPEKPQRQPTNWTP